LSPKDQAWEGDLMIDVLAMETISNPRLPIGLGGRFYGVYAALVSDIKDPAGQGRVKVKLPWSPDTGGAAYETWARMATLMGGANRGTWFIPDVNDEVLILFEGGDPRRPYVIGGLWNGKDSPPETMDGAGANYRKVIRSRNGVKVTLDDQSGQEQLILETPGGQKVTMKDGPGSIDISDSNGNSVKLEPGGITVNASAKVTINASAVEISAGMVTVNAGMSKFSGVVQADTVISQSVISASYTPGAGNIW
jgi:uncharacterized protein involved in type VI secretion and phage assembly